MIYVFLGKDRYSQALKFAKSRFSVIREAEINSHWSEYYDYIATLNNKVITTNNREFLEKLAFYYTVIKPECNIEIYKNGEKIENVKDLLSMVVDCSVDIRK